jgi:uncharacterized delta-60 repeat protein
MRGGTRRAWSNRIVAALAGGAVAVLAGTGVAEAAGPDPGALDRDFGGTGKVTLDIRGHDFVQGAAIDSQGRIVVAGSTAGGTSGDFAVARYMPDGSLDPSFGTGGIVTTDFNGHDDRAVGLGLDPHGRLVVAGTSSGPRGYRFAMARYRQNGSLDAAFGHGGRVLTTVGTPSSTITTMTIDPLGRIVVAGQAYRYHDTFDYFDFLVARFRPNGTLDSTFGRDGTVETNFLYTLDTAYSVAVDSRGWIVAAGEASSYGESSTTAIARYRPGGGLDTSFGDGGKVTTAFGNHVYDAFYAATVDDEGRIVAAGGGSLGHTESTLARYAPDGSLDPSFGSAGKVQTRFPDSSWINAIAIDGLGRIDAVGSNTTGRVGQFALARYKADGSLDRSFGTRGKVMTPFGRDNDVRGIAAAIDEHGRIVAAGTVYSGDESDFALARYIGRDKAPPDVKVKGKSRFRTRHDRRRARFRLKASEPVDFRCKIDGGRFHDCSSPYRTPRLGIGRHRLKVKATDQAGNTGADKKRFRIVARG